jgi:hypothetical protein
LRAVPQGVATTQLPSQTRLLVLSCFAALLYQKELTLDISKILNELRRERDRINDAIAALEKVTTKSNGRRGPRRHAGRPRRRRLTPEGRKRLSDMMKKRWAERKRRAKVA